MACCLTAPNHYLNQCWLIIRGVMWHSSENSFAGIAQGINSGYEFEKDILIIIFKSPRGQWVKYGNCGGEFRWLCFEAVVTNLPFVHKGLAVKNNPFVVFTTSSGALPPNMHSVLYEIHTSFWSELFIILAMITILLDSYEYFKHIYQICAIVKTLSFI